MDGIEVHSEGRQAAEPGRRARRQWTAAEKRRIVREAERAGAVKQQVARVHGVHVSVLNRWRAELRVMGSGGKKKASTVRLLPVRVRTSRPPRAQGSPVGATMTATAGDLIEVAFPAGQRLTVRGMVDAGLLRTVLEELSRC